MAKLIKDNEKVVELMLTIPLDLYIKFKDKTYAEGYSVREALRLLVVSYLSDDIKPASNKEI